MNETVARRSTRLDMAAGRKCLYRRTIVKSEVLRVATAPQSTKQARERTTLMAVSLKCAHLLRKFCQIPFCLRRKHTMG